MIQTTDTTEEMDNKSSGNELLKSLKKNANKLKEIGKITEQVFCQKLLPNKEKTEWDEVIKNCVNENLQCSVCMEIFIKVLISEIVISINYLIIFS